MNSPGTVDSMFLLYDISCEVREKKSLGAVESMFLLYDMRREVRQMNSHGTVDSTFLLYDIIGELERLAVLELLIVCSCYMTSVVKLER